MFSTYNMGHASKILEINCIDTINATVGIFFVCIAINHVMPINTS